MITDILAWTVPTILFLVGIAGIFVPGLPGVPIVFAGFLVGGVLDKFTNIKWWMVVVAAVLTVLSVVVDNIGTIIGVRKFKGSKWGVLGAIAGFIIGIIVGGWGVLVFPVLLAVVFEFAVDGDFRRAAKSGVGVVTGFVFSVALNLIMAIFVIALFVIAKM